MKRSITYKNHKKALLVHGNKSKYQKFMKSIKGRWNSRINGEEPGWVVPLENEDILKAYINKIEPDIVADNNTEINEDEERSLPTNQSDGSVCSVYEEENLPAQPTQSTHPMENVEPAKPIHSESEVLQNLSAFIDEKEKVFPETVENDKDVREDMKQSNNLVSGLKSDSTLSEDASFSVTPVIDKPIIEAKKSYESLIKNKLKEERENKYHTLESLSKRTSRKKDNTSMGTYDCFTFYKIFTKKPKKFRKLYYDDDSNSEIEEDRDEEEDEEEEDIFKHVPRPYTPVKYKKDYVVEDERTISEIVKSMKKLQKQMYDFQIKSSRIESSNVA